MKKLFTLLFSCIFLFGIGLNAQSKVSNLEASLSSDGILKIMAVPGSAVDNLMELTVENGNLLFSDLGRQIFSKDRKVSTAKYSIPLTKLPSQIIEVYGGDGDDNLLINYSQAFASQNFHIRYYGQGNRTGTIGDVMSFRGETTDQFRHDAINKTDGIVYMDNSVFEYKGLEPITSTITAANVILNYSSADEAITISDAGSSQTTVASTAGESVTFNPPSNSLNIDAGAGNDIVNFNSLGANIPNITIDGGAGSNSLNVDAQGNCVIDNGNTIMIDGLYSFAYSNFSVVNITNIQILYP